jgi:hydroxymethylpyrimidine/phosphomethylpyrimidine kinase
MKIALTIAGSDSSGGAGIQADLKTFAAHGVFGLSAITAVTAQNTLGVADAAIMTPALVTAQIDAVISDLGADAVKTGMLGNAGVTAAVADAVERHALRRLVVDPVMLATSGARLMDEAALGVLRARVMPLAMLVTPNVAEAEILTGLRIRTAADLALAARRLVELGARAALVKGGHLDGPATDVFWDGSTLLELVADRQPGRHTHGTGCTLSAAITARLALGDDLPDAVRQAKAYVTKAIAQAPALGHGHGPVQHFPRTSASE